MPADLDITLSLDTTGFDRGIDTAEKRLTGFERTGQRVSKQRLDVAPTGAGELDSASKSAEGLSRGLDSAAKSAGRVKAPSGVGQDLNAAAAAADRLNRELVDAARASTQLKPNPSVPSSLDASAQSAGQLGTELGKASAEAQNLGASGGGVDRMEGSLAGLASTARNLVPALSAGAAATAAITKGWGRLTSIDDATFKLQGLGHEAESVSDIMNSAMDSVTGTAYGFGDAASLAAGVVAATGAEGERLTQVLTTVADTAAISGRELSDIGLIFNQVAASGTLMGDDLAQLMDSGIPVITMLADEMGVAADEVKGLASDGEVSFEIFESAMRKSMGGAAQEMGQSVTGALANVGAAVGRLGAAALDPAFSALPDVLGGITDGVDALTDGVSAAIGVWDDLPGPIQAAVGGLVAARGATMLLNTELGGKLVDHLLSVKDRVVSGAGAFRGFGSDLSTAYGYIRQANPEMGRMAAGMELVAGKGGLASTAMGGLRGAAGGLLSALGGPWGLAIGGAAAAVGLFTQHVQKTRQAQEEAEAATKGWADALADADGQITDSVQKHAVATVQNEEWADSLEAVGLSTADAAAAILDLDGAYGSTIEQLDGMIASSLDYRELRGQERVDARDRVNELRDVRDGLIELNGQRAEGAAQAEEAAESERELATAAAEGFANTDRAIPKYAEMNGVLEQMGIDADTAEDAIDNLATATMNYLYGIDPDPAVRFQGIMADSAAAVQDFGDALEGGMGGFDTATGQFDVWDEQGQKLAGTMDGLRESIHLAAAAQYEASIEAGDSGVVAAEKAAAAAEEYTERLREQAYAAGWDKEQVDALIDSYNLAPEDIYTQIHVEGVEIADELIRGLDESLTRVDAEKYEIVVDSDALDLTKEQAEELGFTLEEVGGLTTLTAETEQAQNALEEFAARTEELGTADNTVVFRADVEQLTEALNEVEDTTAEWTNRPREIPVIADTEAARAAIKEVGVEATELPDGYLYIEDNSPRVMQDLFNLGAETIALPEGNIILDTNSPEVLGMLKSVEFQTITLPDGRVVLNHDDIHSAFQAMLDAGALVREGADGELRVDNNFWENEQAVEALAQKVREGASGQATMSHNAFDVRDAVADALDGLQTSGSHTQHVQAVVAAETSARIAGQIGMPGMGGATGGRFSPLTGFDYLPGYAAGDRHDGYQLPRSGPGTGVTDGFLALDQAGVPVARLDAREWVINGESSEKHNELLHAVNRDDPAAILAAVMRRLPGLAGGGTVGAARTIPTPGSRADGTTGDAGAGVDLAGTTTSVLDHAALLGELVDDIPEEKTTTVTLTAEGVADEIALIGQRLEPLGEGETITVDAVGDQAMSVLDAVGVETTSLPDGSVVVHAATGDALDDLGNVSQMLFEVGDVVVEPEALLDTRELEVSAEDAQIILDALDIENPTPYASLIIDDLVNGKGIAQGELEFLASMVPTPAADLNTALLDAGVQVSESELQRVGNQKATSVVDVNNQSALQNVQATLDALNRMPVERTIRIVAAGSAASAIGQYNQGGRIPALASGGRLPTTGPGTDRTDGILGVGTDGVPTAMVDAGEWVITRNRSQQFDRTLGAINAGNQRDIYEALKADLPGMPDLQHLNKGGVVSPEQLLDFAAGNNVNGQQASRSLQGAPYVWGGVNWGDCSGAMAGLANFAAGLNAFGSRFATGNQREATAALGFNPGLGDPATSFNLGWFNGGPWGGHTAGDIGGTAVEMGGGAGGQGKIGGAAASASSGQFTDHAHLTLGELWAFDLFRALPALTERYQPAPDPNWVTEGGDGVSPGGLGLQVAQGLGGGVSHTGGDGVHFNDGTVIPYERGRLYDTGGIWPTGTWGFNSTGGDEMVLPPRETEQFKALPEAAEAMHAVADAVGGLHPELRRMVDDIAPQMVSMASSTDQALSHLQAIADYQSAEGVVARATAGRVLDMDILPYSSELQGILDAEAQLWEARAAQEDRARAITEAENSLSEARAELARLQSEDPGMSVQDQRKIADAEEAVAKARADGDPEKVADAEQKLARTREDAANSASEDAVKRQEDIAKATDGVTAAEQDLSQARRESVEALDQSLYSVLPQLNHGLSAASTQLGGLASQLGAMGGLAAGVAPMLGGVAGQLASVAAFAGPAGISIGMVLSIVQTVLSVFRQIGSIIGDLAEAASAGRTAAAQAHAESVSAIREWTSVVDQQRQTVSRLRQSVVRAEMEIVSAQWEVRTAQLDVGRAQLEGVRSVAEAEAALAAERERQARADWWQYNDLTLAYDRLRWAQQDVAYGQLEDYATVTPEIMALQHEVLAAQLTSAGSVHAAQLASLQASFGLMEAQKLLARGQRDLNHAMAEYNRMSGTSFGLTTPEAIVAEEIARLQAENARLAGDRPQASGLLGKLDFDGDGRILFGLIDLVGQERNALQSAIDANNKAIENLLNSGHAPDWDEATWAEAMSVIDRAAEMYRRGNDASAEALIAGSVWGDAERALNENRVLDEIAQWEQSQRDLEDEIEDLRDTVGFEEMAQPLRELIAAIEAGANSAQYSADALREQNPAIRAALEALAEFEGGAARDIRDGRPIQHVTIVGENFSAEQIQGLLDQLAGHGQELEVRVERLEQPDRPTARDVMAARR